MLATSAIQNAQISDLQEPGRYAGLRKHMLSWLGILLIKRYVGSAELARNDAHSLGSLLSFQNRQAYRISFHLMTTPNIEAYDVVGNA